METIRKQKSAYLLYESAYNRIYGADERYDIARLTDSAPCVLHPDDWHMHADICEQTELLFSGWGMPPVDEAFLEAFPRLTTIFYGAGSIKGFATDALWKRGINVTSASYANAIPVCEFTVAQIVLSMKHAWRLSTLTDALRTYPDFTQRESPGMYRTVVGLVSLGSIGRMVAERLRQYDVAVIAYDPVIRPEQAKALGVELCALDALFRDADVVSCHAPWLKETESMLTYEHFASMKQGATFINTSRGAIVDEVGLIQALQERRELYALLDVTLNEPPAPDSPLYTLPNAILTPHIAGSKGKECNRLGRTMVEELLRHIEGKPLRHAISQEQAVLMA